MTDFKPEQAGEASGVSPTSGSLAFEAQSGPEARPARLTVVVYPWGDIWIDGKRRGSAPLKNVALKPGRYKISAGRKRPSKAQTIRLREAERKTIQFDLTK